MNDPAASGKDSRPGHGLKRGLPNRFYNSDDVFLEERERIFEKTWVGIGFACDVPENRHAYPVEFMGLPLFLLRGDDGQLRVFHNVCRHRGHKLVSEAGKLPSLIRCPYHAWTYALDGRLKGTPHIGGVGVHTVDGFDPEHFPLVQIRSRTWNGVVFVNLDGEAEPFDSFVEPLSGRFEALWGNDADQLLRFAVDEGRLRFDLGTNWKLAVENYLEAYHLPFIHRALNKNSPLERHGTFVAQKFAGQVSLGFQSGSGTNTAMPRFPEWPTTRLTEAEYPVLFPNTLFGLQADHFYAGVVIPVAYNQTREEIRLYYVGDEALEDRYAERRKEQLDFWNGVFREDVSAVIGMQEGRRSFAFDGGVLSPAHEKATAAFHEWVATRHAGSSPT